MKRILFYLKYALYKPKAISFYNLLNSSCYLSKNQYDDQSFNKFLQIFNFAFQHSNFYNKKYKAAGISPELIKTKNDIKKIPILTKQEVKDNLFEILTVPSNHKNLGKGATGGSTGVPMPYFTDKVLPLEAFAWRYLKWWGLNPWDDGAYIWRMTRKSKISNFLNLLAWWPVKKIRLDASLLTAEKFQYFVSKINKIKPKLIQGYIGAVYEFALYLEKNNVDIFKPDAIWVTSAPVTIYQRDLIERVFNAPLYNEYGSSEIPWIAAQCKERKYLHINTEGRYLEVINTNSLGEGDIIITDLLNFSFPLIRYELGDKTKIINDKCACGCNLPLIEEVKGRSGDLIVLTDNRKIDASFLTTIFDNYPNSIKSFQLIQHKNYNITLKVVPNHNYQLWENEINTVYRNLLELTEHKIKIDIEYCSEIKSDRGKTKYIIRET